MNRYLKQTRLLLAVDCIIFGFDGTKLKLLLIRRGMDPQRGKWSLMGGFVQQDEDCETAANRILKQLTGLEGVYLEQVQTFSNPKRDPAERTVSVVFFALVDIRKYEEQLNDHYSAHWFTMDEIPKLIFDHSLMVEKAMKRLKDEAALNPVLFELLPKDFTLPQVRNLYEAVYNTELDKRNFNRKLLSTGLLVKQNHKDKQNSKKGAYYYRLHKKAYSGKFQSFIN